MTVKLTLIKASLAVSLSLRFAAITASWKEHTNYTEKVFQFIYEGFYPIMFAFLDRISAGSEPKAVTMEYGQRMKTY